jgi:urease accessory protein
VAGLYLQAFASNVVLAAVRFVPLGAGEGQKAIAALRPVCLAVARQAVLTPPDRIATAAIGAELAAMRHATLETRVFRT